MHARTHTAHGHLFFGSVQKTEKRRKLTPPRSLLAVRTAHALHCAGRLDRSIEPVNPCGNCCFQVVIVSNEPIRTYVRQLACISHASGPNMSKSTTGRGPYGTQALSHFRSASHRIASCSLLPATSCVHTCVRCCFRNEAATGTRRARIYPSTWLVGFHNGHRNPTTAATARDVTAHQLAHTSVGHICDRQLQQCMYTHGARVS